MQLPDTEQSDELADQALNRLADATSCGAHAVCHICGNASPARTSAHGTRDSRPQVLSKVPTDAHSMRQERDRPPSTKLAGKCGLLSAYNFEFSAEEVLSKCISFIALLS